MRNKRSIIFCDLTTRGWRCTCPNSNANMTISLNRKKKSHGTVDTRAGQYKTNFRNTELFFDKRGRQNEDTQWQNHCWRDHVSQMSPLVFPRAQVFGGHKCCALDTKKCFWKSSETFVVFARRATMCPRFGGIRKESLGLVTSPENQVLPDRPALVVHCKAFRSSSAQSINLVRIATTTSRAYVVLFLVDGVHQLPFLFTKPLTLWR